MSTFTQANRESQSRTAADGYARTESPAQTTLQQAHNPLDSQREMLNQSPEVQSHIQLQQMLNQSPHVVAQAKLAEAMNGPQGSRSGQRLVQRQEALEDEEALEQQTSLEEETTQLLSAGEEELPV